MSIIALADLGGESAHQVCPPPMAFNAQKAQVPHVSL